MDELLKQLASIIDTTLESVFRKRLGFALIVFEFGEGNKAGDYISNGNREDMIKALRETADRLEANEDIPPAVGSC